LDWPVHHQERAFLWNISNHFHRVNLNEDKTKHIVKLEAGFGVEALGHNFMILLFSGPGKFKKEVRQYMSPDNLTFRF